jgi:prevent-host-death family protein
VQTLSAKEAKTHFGQMILKSQLEPVRIDKNGKPVAVVMSIEAYDQIEACKAQQLKEQIDRSVKAIEAGDTVDGRMFMKELLADR